MTFKNILNIVKINRNLKDYKFFFENSLKHDPSHRKGLEEFFYIFSTLNSTGSSITQKYDPKYYFAIGFPNGTTFINPDENRSIPFLSDSSPQPELTNIDSDKFDKIKFICVEPDLSQLEICDNFDPNDALKYNQLFLYKSNSFSLYIEFPFHNGTTLINIDQDQLLSFLEIDSGLTNLN